MNFTRHIALLTIVAGMMQPAFAMKKVEPEEAFFRALTKPSNLRLAGNLFENEEILKPALAYAHKLFKSRVVEWAQAERRPWEGQDAGKVSNVNLSLLRLFKAADVLKQLELIKRDMRAKREFVNRDFRMGYGYDAAYDYGFRQADHRSFEEKWREEKEQERRQRADLQYRQWKYEVEREQEERRLLTMRREAQIKPVQLKAETPFDVERVQMPIRPIEKLRYTFQDARAAIGRGDVAQLFEILETNALGVASIQDLLSVALDMGNDEIVQLLFAKVEQFNAPSEAKVTSIQFNPKGNSNIDEL